jgi:hypothetical protein
MRNLEVSSLIVRSVLIKVTKVQISISWYVSAVPDPVGIRKSKRVGIVKVKPMTAGTFAVKVSESHPASGVMRIGGIAAVK